SIPPGSTSPGEATPSACRPMFTMTPRISTDSQKYSSPASDAPLPENLLHHRRADMPAGCNLLLDESDYRQACIPEYKHRRCPFAGAAHDLFATFLCSLRIHGIAQTR